MKSEELDGLRCGLFCKQHNRPLKMSDRPNREGITGLKRRVWEKDFIEIGKRLMDIKKGVIGCFEAECVN